MKKKIIAGVLAVLLIGGGVPYYNYFTQNTAIVASAITIPESNISFTDLGDSIQINCLKYNSDCPAEVILPSTINEKPVTVIGNGNTIFNQWVDSRRYDSHEYVKKIIIPNTVKTINDNAFDTCYNVTEIEIPSSVTTIGNYAFKSCASLLSAEIPDNGGDLTIGDGAFIGCSKIVNFTFPDRVTSVGRGCFAGCTSLASIILSKNMKTLQNLLNSTAITSVNTSGKEINYGAEVGFFEKCYSLKSIEIPDSVQNMDDKTFKDCNALSKITLGAGIEALGAINLESTTLQSVNISEENLAYSSIDGVLFDNTKKRLIRYPVDYYAVKYYIPDTVNEVDKNAFSESKYLNYLIFPENVSVIPQGLFNNCKSLKKIKILNKECEIKADIPENVEIVGYTGSTTEKYARQMGYTFIDIESGTESLDTLVGDVNADGMIDAVDATFILSYYAYTSTHENTSVSIFEYINNNKSTNTDTIN